LYVAKVFLQTACDINCAMFALVTLGTMAKIGMILFVSSLLSYLNQTQKS